MGVSGPVPKRSEERRRQNAPATPFDKVTVTGKVRVPRPDPNWHPFARSWYLSLRRSAQTEFYEPSDWQTAFLIAESLSRDLEPQFVAFDERDGEPIYAKIPLKGASLSAYMKAFGDLMVTEGARRRAGIEITRRQPQADAGLSDIDAYRRARQG